MSSLEAHFIVLHRAEIVTCNKCPFLRETPNLSTEHTNNDDIKCESCDLIAVYEISLECQIDSAHSKLLCYICGPKVKYMTVHMEKRHKGTLQPVQIVNLIAVLNQQLINTLKIDALLN